MNMLLNLAYLKYFALLAVVLLEGIYAYLFNV